MAGKKYDREKANAVAEGNWVPSPEAKSKSLWFRIGAIVLWAVAIGLEIFVIVKYLLPSKPVNTWLIIGLIVAIGQQRPAIVALGIARLADQVIGQAALRQIRRHRDPAPLGLVIESQGFSRPFEQHQSTGPPRGDPRVRRVDRPTVVHHS